MLDHPLYQAVIENPDDDSLRLLFADWMDDLGDPRGDFIRLQLRLADSNLTRHDRTTLEATEAELLHQNRSRWNGPLHKHLSLTTDLTVQKRRGKIRPWTYARGFVSHLTVDAAAYMRHHARISLLGPIEHVRFHNLRDVQNLLFRSPCLRKLKSISFAVQPYYGPPNDLRLFREVAGSRYLQQLRTLKMSHLAISPRAARILVGSSLPRLEWLDVRNCYLMRDAADILFAHFGKQLASNPPPQRRSAPYRSAPVQSGTIARWARGLLNG